MLLQSQYARDISLVLDNNEDVNMTIHNYTTTPRSRSELSNFLADMYYVAINDALDYLDESPQHVLAKELIAELCLNLGVSVFDQLADLFEETP